MKKFIIIFLILLVLIICGSYFLLFTQPGNGFLKPIIQNKIAKKTGVNIKITQFILRPSYLMVKLKGLNAFKTDATINFSIFNGNINGKIDTKIIDFSKLKKFTKRKLNGKCNINITLTGNYKNNLKIDIFSDIFHGISKIKIVKNGDKLDSLYYQFKSLKISEILKFLDLNTYATGFIDSFGDFKFNNNKGNGKTLFTGHILGKNIYKDFQINVPYTKFNGEILNTFKDNIIYTNANIYSNIAEIFISKALFYLKTKTLTSNYIINIPKLSVFNELAQQHFKGFAKISGKLKFDKKLFTNGTIKINNNTLTYTFNQPDFNLSSNNFDSIDILKTLSYPPIFKTLAKLNLDYNVNTKKGILNINFDKGVFGNTNLFRTIKKFTGVDITIEVYRNGFLKTLINDKLLNTDFDLKSKKTEFSSKNFIVDLNKKIVNGKVDADILGALIHIIISGNLNKPEIKTDIKDIFKNQLLNINNVKENEKNIKKNIEKEIKKKKNEIKSIKKQLKGLFNNFK